MEMSTDRADRTRATRRRVLQRALVGTLIVVVAGAVAAPVSADGPVHVKETLGPFVADAPAGTLCDFDYHQEALVTRNSIRWFDDAGNLVRVEAQVEFWVLHQNVDTGLTLTEEGSFAAHIDFVANVEYLTGQSWHLRDENGTLVLVGAGLIFRDRGTGEVILETPNARADFAETNCTALGGAPA
jgi:hypothetical protein